MSSPTSGAVGPMAAPPTDDGVRWPLDLEVDGVAVLRWPEEATARDRHTRQGTPRLLVVADDGAAPLVWSDDEDWVRAGAAPAEVGARLARLAPADEVAATTAAPAPSPTLDAEGVLRTADGSVLIVPPVEARLLAALLHRTGSVARRDDLVAAAWPAGDVGERALDGRIKLLRRRLRDTGLTIHTVRGVGYLLEVKG